MEEKKKNEQEVKTESSISFQSLQEKFLQEQIYQQKKAQFACMRGEFKKKG